MHFTSSVLALGSLALTSAAPLQARDPLFGTVTFNGAADASYSLTVYLDGTTTYTNNVLSISSVSSSTIDIESQCTLDTVDFPPALVEGPTDTWVIGPPQTVTSITCVDADGGSSPPSTETIVIEFDGADPSEGAKYSLSVPLDGSVVATNNALSISTVVSDFAALATNCDFVTVDFTPALVAISANTWAVGPPQTVTSVSCHA